jgi:hypothetical protein
MGIERGKELQVKDIGNIFINVIAEFSQFLRKRRPSKYRRPLELQTDKTKKEPLQVIL